MITVLSTTGENDCELTVEFLLKQVIHIVVSLPGVNISKFTCTRVVKNQKEQPFCNIILNVISDLLLASKIPDLICMS